MASDCLSKASWLHGHQRPLTSQQIGGHQRLYGQRNNLVSNIVYKSYSDSFVFGALALSLAIVRTNFDGLNDFISVKCHLIYLVILYLHWKISEINSLRPSKSVLTIANDNANAP